MAFKETGFTLIEIALVLVIIGLLIGGVLKGQELVKNASVTAVTSTLNETKGAVLAFRDRYGAFPGDLPNASVRLADCAAGTSCADAPVANLGDGRITGQPGAAQANMRNENGAAWAQLAVTQFMKGVRNVASATAPTPYVSIPGIDLGRNSGMQIGHTTGGLLMETGGFGVDANPGHWVLIDRSGAAASSEATASMKPAIVEMIDVRLDNGLPATGEVIGMGGAGIGGALRCANNNTATGIYNSNSERLLCGVYYQIVP